MVSDAEAANINDYVAGGGHAVVTFFSGIVDEDDRVRLGGYPGAFRETLGITVEEFAPLLPGDTVTLDSGATASLWTERLRTTGAEVLASYVDGPVPGTPAITRNTFGAGVAWYVATALDSQAGIDLMSDVVQAANVTAIGPETDGTVEVVRRAASDRSYLFVINHGTTGITYPTSGVELVTGDPVKGNLEVPAGAVRVIREVPEA
jgi:beta-galactosidase